MTATESERLDLEHYLSKTYCKTASLMANSAKAVAVLGGHSPEVSSRQTAGVPPQAWTSPHPTPGSDHDVASTRCGTRLQHALDHVRLCRARATRRRAPIQTPWLR